MSGKHIILIWSLLLAYLPGIKAGVTFNGRDLAGEQINLQTDRTLYIVGENIHFSAFIFQAPGSQVNEDSKILYVELITPGSGKICGGKYVIAEHLCTGWLGIPKEGISGIYYLRAYTKSMRNRGPQTYSYVQLKIVNPLKPDVLVTVNTNQGSTDRLAVASPETKELFTIHCNKEAYEPRDEVKLEISNLQGDARHYRNLVLSVVPDSSIQLNRISIPQLIYADTLHHYYPEKDGLSLTGHVYDKKTDKPLSSTRVNLSIFGEKDFIAVNTDSTGAFFFSLPGFTGTKELFICSEISPGTTPAVYIDNDFCSADIHLPAPVFQLSKWERETALKLAQNIQVASVYEKASAPAALPPEKQEDAFYGIPSDILILDQYVELPTLEEYFNELPGIVKVRKKANRSYFQFSSEQAEMDIFGPLVMVDWVAIDDVEKILNLSPKLISRIELVNVPYIKGDITYGGIVNFISKKNDFAGIDLPSSGVFINFSFLHPVGDEMMKQADPGMPDTRNTLYWNPVLNPGSGNHPEIQITAPDTPGRYIVLLRGITEQGEMNTWNTTFQVR